MAARLQEAESAFSPVVHRPSFLTTGNIVAAAILLASSLWLAWWFWDRSGWVFVSDARISSTMVTVSGRVPGWVTEFPIEEGQKVGKGEKLGEIDSRQAQVRLAQIDASIKTVQAQYQHQESQLELAEKQVVSRIRAQRSRLEAAESALSESRLALAQAETDWRRARSLLEQDIISRELFEQRQASHDKARETLNQRRAQLAEAEADLAEAEANRAQIDVLRADLEVTRSRERELEVERERAQIDLADHVIRSPVDGVIDETFINLGEYVTPGQRILLAHNPDEIWINANVKETEIRHVQAGSPVIVKVDAFPGRQFQGEIVRVGQAATSEFALLPSPNPSGNFTKITQRIQVKVAIDQVDGLLKPGMMVELKIAAR